MKKNFGGNRLGTGAKFQVDMHNWGRSNFNLSESFKSTMTSGVLIPCYVNIGLNGDTFSIKTDSLVRTIPTIGPMFGTYKYQIDYFVIPQRLYNGKLHNNPINVGMDMHKIKYPKISVHTKVFNPQTSEYENSQISPSCLLKYLGLSGLKNTKGIEKLNDAQLLDSDIYRQINAIFALSYYDIFKNYYANKQEENAYVITPKITPITTNITQIQLYDSALPPFEVINTTDNEITLTAEQFKRTTALHIYGNDITTNNIVGIYEGLTYRLEQLKEMGLIKDYTYITQKKCIVVRKEQITDETFTQPITLTTAGTATKSEIQLTAFPLKNIDRAREEILSKTDNQNILIAETNYGGNACQYLPYSTLYEKDIYGTTKNYYEMNGLCVKTYLSDIFNNWVQTEYIDGENGIAEVTKVDTSDGLKLDALNLAQKVYNMLNKIAVSGGTYEDWQEVVYGEKVIKKAETPMYCGSFISEVVFDEVISTAATQEDALGTIAGRGRLVTKKGGTIDIKIEEPSIIMGIVSITPRIDYTHGNAWYLDLDNYGQLHAPDLDQIGYQDLITEWAAWYGTTTDEQAMGTYKHAVGKTPAWINYMTAVDKAFGNFCKKYEQMFMINARNYTPDDYDTAGIKDFTTYIDPTKYNYAFADQELSAQNFWVQIAHRITARRKMSAKIIPNL